MPLWQRLTRAYFDAVYNPLYDSTTARLSRYVDSQKMLAARLCVERGHRVLSVGLGTGNELAPLRAQEPDMDVVGIDLSPAALARARRKPAGRDTALALMDAQQLAFRSASFDKLLCYHVTDFLPEPATAAAEMMRVLRPGGRFVISFPSGGDGLGLAASLFAHGRGKRKDSSSFTRRLRSSATMFVNGLIYLPLMLRPKPVIFTPGEVEKLLRPLGAGECVIENDPVYRDLLVSGFKNPGGKTDAA
jgi:SAM-dependent methyltransferase